MPLSPDGVAPDGVAPVRATAHVAGRPGSSRRAARSGRGALWAAAAVGLLHAGFSAYWMVGGTWLVQTLGERVLAQFGRRPLLLAPVVAVKVVAAVGPLWMDARGWPRRRLVRAAAWLTAGILMVWGGLNTVVGNLVLAGVLNEGGAIDRAAMVGHAWLWDPMFALWGALLAVGLLRTRPPTAERDGSDRRTGWF